MFFNKKKKERIKAIDLTDQNFEETVIDSSHPILIDFWAPWCGPCKVMGPIINELAEEYQGKAIVAKVNIDENPALSDHFKIQSIPSFIMIKDNTVVSFNAGMVPKPNLAEALDQLIEPQETSNEQE